MIFSLISGVLYVSVKLFLPLSFPDSDPVTTKHLYHSQLGLNLQCVAGADSVLPGLTYQ